MGRSHASRFLSQAASTRSAACSGGSCSHTRTTDQLAESSAASVCRSRRTVRRSLSRHHCALAFGWVACCGQLCQKQPSTKTAIRARVKTRSARRRNPGRGRHRPGTAAPGRAATAAGLAQGRCHGPAGAGTCPEPPASWAQASGRTQRVCPAVLRWRAKVGACPSRMTPASSRWCCCSTCPYPRTGVATTSTSLELAGLGVPVRNVSPAASPDDQAGARPLAPPVISDAVGTRCRRRSGGAYGRWRCAGSG